MNPLQPVVDVLRRLPNPVRQTIYALLTLVGAVLGALKGFGVTDLGPVSVDQALQIYAFISPFVGAVAVANVNRQPTDTGMPAIAGFSDDVDLSSFEPVGDSEDVYDRAAW